MTGFNMLNEIIEWEEKEKLLSFYLIIGIIKNGTIEKQYKIKL
jgi:hypothetical protein